ncbi:MAG: SUMF1/EgtB/PvdO family nonheme iron enzyme [Pseudomonadota bacterium]
MKSFVRIKLAALTFVIAGPAISEIEWRESYYNPAPTAGDLTLPMPCGGAMTFRPVETPNAGGAIGDVRVTLGQESEDRPYLNGLRRSYVSGAFPTADASSMKGQFWIGKYEIAEAQWDAVMLEACPESTPRKRAFVPAVEHTPLEIARFAERYTLWLLETHPDVLPSAGETRAYLRLPTEDEWEFAVRGGLVVGDAEFRAPLPPTGDGREPSEFIAHGGTDSAGGKVQVIGTLAPNPLGLHDMLGNVGEIVATPFALVRHGRLHGQAGGVVKRGGDARTPLADISSATRFEVPPFDLNKLSPSADRFTGARLAIAGLSITSAAQTTAMMDDLDRIARIDPNLVNAGSEEEIDAILKDIEASLDNPRGVQQLNVIRRTIEAGRAERNAQRDRSIRLILESGTLVCDQVLQRLLNALAINALDGQYAEFEEEARRTGDDALMAEVRAAQAESDAKLAELDAQMRSEMSEFAALVEGLGSDYSLSLLSRHLAFIADDVRARGPRRGACLGALDRHLDLRAEVGFVDLAVVERDLREIALDRATLE